MSGASGIAYHGPEDVLSIATGINDHGEIVGFDSNIPYLPAVTFVYFNGKSQRLPAVEQGYKGNGINNLGDVAGIYLNRHPAKAFVFTPTP